MESISSTGDYASILENMILDDVNLIRKSAIIDHLGQKIDIAQNVANEITDSMNNGSHYIDNTIPENSTFSIHI